MEVVTLYTTWPYGERPILWISAGFQTLVSFRTFEKPVRRTDLEIRTSLAPTNSDPTFYWYPPLCNGQQNELKTSNHNRTFETVRLSQSEPFRPLHHSIFASLIKFLKTKNRL